MLTQDHISKSVELALRGESGIDHEILKIRGFSTPTIRHLFHTLCNTDYPITYLEIGLFCGASFCASFNKNCTSVGVENHSQDFSAGFDQVKKELKENVDEFCHLGKMVDVHHEDCFKMDKSFLPKINIYCYDGFHSFETQSKALPEFLDSMNDKFVFLVDDFSWSYVKQGTLHGFDLLKDKIEIEREWILGEGLQNHHVWHNGVAIYLINKK